MKNMKSDFKTPAIEFVQTARHPERPYAMDIFSEIFENFIEIHGDRRFADDAALVCGLAALDGEEVVVIGQQKGRDTNQRRLRNFGMPKPEGYRKALRVMKMAEKFKRPIISFIDTPGAYPGIDAEERGQAEAIAFNLREMAGLKAPVIVVILGEGGSGGALAIGVGDRVLMMENSIYSVISPEGCAAILWKDAGESARAAESLRLTATDLYGFGLIDEIIPENSIQPINDIKKPDKNSETQTEMKFEVIFKNLKLALLRNLKDLRKIEESKRVANRYKKFRMMGKWNNKI